MTEFHSGLSWSFKCSYFVGDFYQQQAISLVALRENQAQLAVKGFYKLQPLMTVLWLVSTFSLLLDVNRAIELMEKLQSSELIIFAYFCSFYAGST